MTQFINLHFQLCEQGKKSSVKLEKERLSAFNLFVFSSQAEDMQKEVILSVFTLLRSGDFNSQMCFQKVTKYFTYTFKCKMLHMFE